MLDLGADDRNRMDDTGKITEQGLSNPETAQQPPSPPKKARRREQQRAIETRRVLLEAALNEFAERGFDGASMRRIGERASLEFTLIKYHFHSKEALWRAVAERAFEQIEAMWDEAIPADSELSAADRVKIEFRTFQRFTVAHTAFHHFMLRENQGASPRLAWLIDKLLKRTMSRILPQIRQAQDDGQLIQGNPAHVYYLLIGMSSVLSSLNGEMDATVGFSLNDSKGVDEFWDLIDRAMFR
jgi:AcrR family transcriptional regulator